MELFSTITTIIAAIITVVGIVITIKSRSCRLSKLYYSTKEAYNIFNKFSTEFDNFQLQYKSEPITNSIIYISGELICVGHDINSDNNHINLFIPDGFKWIDFSLSKSHEEINATINIDKHDETKAILKFDKLRQMEIITINAVLETDHVLTESQVNTIQNNLVFDHRINDTESVEINTWPNINGSGDSYLLKIIIGLISILSISTFAISMDLREGRYTDLVYLPYVLTAITALISSISFYYYTMKELPSEKKILKFLILQYKRNKHRVKK